MIDYTIPKDIEKDAKDYMQNVLEYWYVRECR